MDRKQTTIHYRKFSPGSDPKQHSLEQCIRNAMGCKENGFAISEQYVLRILPSDGQSIFVNIYNDSNDSVFGDLIMFSAGEMQSVFDASDPKTPTARVEQLRPPAKKEYVKSQMFWFVKGNNVFIIQSMSLRTDILEKYMTWFLSQKTHIVKSEPGIVLESKFDPAAVGGDLQDIQQIVVGGAVGKPIIPQEPSVVEQVEVVEGQQIERAGVTGWQKAWDILKSLLGGEADVKRIMDNVPPEAELAVSVSIGFKSKKRKNISREALRDLEVGLRNLPDSELSVVGKQGKKTSDGQLRLQHIANIKLMTFKDGEKEIVGSLLDPQDTLRAMIEAYNVFVSNGKIAV